MGWAVQRLAFSERSWPGDVGDDQGRKGERRGHGAEVRRRWKGLSTKCQLSHARTRVRRARRLKIKTTASEPARWRRGVAAPEIRRCRGRRTHPRGVGRCLTGRAARGQGARKRGDSSCIPPSRAKAAKANRSDPVGLKMSPSNPEGGSAEKPKKIARTVHEHHPRRQGG